MCELDINELEKLQIEYEDLQDYKSKLIFDNKQQNREFSRNIKRLDFDLIDIRSKFEDLRKKLHIYNYANLYI